MKKALLLFFISIFIISVSFAAEDDMQLKFTALPHFEILTGYAFAGPLTNGDTAKLRTYYKTNYDPVNEEYSGVIYSDDPYFAFGYYDTNQEWDFDPGKLKFYEGASGPYATYVNGFNEIVTTDVKETDRKYALFTANHARFYAKSNGNWDVQFSCDKYLKKDGSEEHNLPVFDVMIKCNLATLGSFQPHSSDSDKQTLTLTGSCGMQVGSYENDTSKNKWGVYATVGFSEDWYLIEAGDYRAEVLLTVNISD